MKDIPGYEGLYAATRDGKIWDYGLGKYLIPCINSKGYLRVRLYFGNIRKYFSVHRLIGATYLGLDLCNSEIHVDHINEDKHNNSVENLRLLSGRDNQLAYFGRLGVDTDTHKICFICKQVKLRYEFYDRQNRLDGKSAWCIMCENKYQTEYRTNKKELVNKYQRKYRAKKLMATSLEVS